MEAAALGLRSFREQGMLDDDGVFDLRVEVTTKTVHAVPLPKLRASGWGRTPRTRRRRLSRRGRGDLPPLPRRLRLVLLHAEPLVNLLVDTTPLIAWTIEE